MPRQVEGFDQVEWLVIDDGSTDRTAEVALAGGVDHLVRQPGNLGLARAFEAGLQRALRENADVIVNTDADNQYVAADIGKLTAPILAGTADLVVGARPIEKIESFSPLKKLLQRLGSLVVRLVSGTKVEDAPSGFRAMSRHCASRLHVFNSYTYTLETLIQAGQNGMRVVSVPIRTHPVTRPSRLMRGMLSYIMRSTLTIIRIFAVYRPFRFFALIGSVPFLLGAALFFRFLYFYFLGDGAGHIQSLIFGAVCLLMGFQLFVLGFIADLISVNRQMLERIESKFIESSNRTL